MDSCTLIWHEGCGEAILMEHKGITMEISPGNVVHAVCVFELLSD